MLRPLAETIPAVTVLFKLNGLPTANTHSPTFTLSELPKTMAGNSDLSILIKAKSVLGSAPTTVASNSRFPLFSTTVIFSAP